MSIASNLTFFVGFSIGLASWFAILIYGIKAVRRARPGVSIWGRETLWNPANILLRPALLTDDGRTYRHRCFISVIVFVISVGLPLFISSLGGN